MRFLNFSKHKQKVLARVAERPLNNCASIVPHLINYLLQRLTTVLLAPMGVNRSSWTQMMPVCVNAGGATHSGLMGKRARVRVWCFFPLIFSSYFMSWNVFSQWCLIDLHPVWWSIRYIHNCRRPPAFCQCYRTAHTFTRMITVAQEETLYCITIIPNGGEYFPLVRLDYSQDLLHFPSIYSVTVSCRDRPLCWWETRLWTGVREHRTFVCV